MKRRLKRVPRFLWNVLAGAFLCQRWPTSILAIGWTYRLMQRTAIEHWWRMGGGGSDGTRFVDFARADASLGEYVRQPNWLIGQHGIRGTFGAAAASQGIFRKLRAIAGGLTASFRRNLVIGLQGAANTAVLTVVPSLLMVFGWYVGWNNSFHKGYEQYAHGILISLTGIVLMIGVMFILPMTQARQAITAEWRRFYDFGLIWRLIRRRRLQCLLLAGLFSVSALPINILLALPFVLPQVNPAFLDMMDLELLGFLNAYYFWVGAAGFTLYAGLRRVAAGLYARALAEAVAEGEVALTDLAAAELSLLGRFGLIATKEKPVPHIIVAIVTTATRPAWRAAIAAATAAAWFTFIAQTYVREFLNYHHARGVGNQPLPQAPWFRYVPRALEDVAKEEDRGRSPSSEYALYR